eukprot:TRINITY_DN12127_c0_g2_i4.p1 TRINITY_DN12127_c0_g2~~TRINITY_DN12127_c0_g2_i4.p1  ORF type:complete len:235 (-),score=26.38 TRINITY_DN12127_c0_g2_i4:24-728(-)
MTKQDKLRISQILDRFGMEGTKKMVKDDLGDDASDEQPMATAEKAEPQSCISSARSDVSAACCSHFIKLSSDEASGVDKEKLSTLEWHERLTYTEKVMMHLARAFIMNPEVMVLQRPLHHFNRDIGAFMLKIHKEHVDNRGLCLPSAGMKRRRPRGVFFSPETKDQGAQADVIWQINKITHTVHEIDEEQLADDFSAIKPRTDRANSMPATTVNRLLGAREIAPQRFAFTRHGV